MSAFICSDKHISAIIDGYAHHIADGFAVDKKTDLDLTTTEGKQYLGNLLKNENIRSVNFRYGEKTKLNTFDYQESHNTPSKMETIKLLDSLNYQSCERDDWEFSKAKRIINQMLCSLMDVVLELHNNPEYNKADWCI